MEKLILIFVFGRFGFRWGLCGDGMEWDGMRLYWGLSERFVDFFGRGGGEGIDVCVSGDGVFFLLID